MDSELYRLAEETGRTLKARGILLATAESCTGGWIGQAVTMVPGSSEWFDRGFITYTNIAKMEMLGVQKATLARHGAVSEATVCEMAQGTLARSQAGIVVAVSGVAGPGGGTQEKPVGMVCVAWVLKGGTPIAETLQLPGDRDAVRRETVVRALRGVVERMG
ncbi:MAG: CinA family protein [Burkholderiales bacterium]